MKVFLACLSLLLTTACGGTNGIVIGKPFWVDESGVKHYQIKCQDGDKITRIGVSVDKWDKTKIGDDC